jgi:hypothetical protein
LRESCRMPVAVSCMGMMSSLFIMKEASEQDW